MSTKKACFPPVTGVAHLFSRKRLGYWVKVARLHFYPMAFIAYSMGAASTLSASSKFSLPVYALGYVLLFLIEFCTVLANEYYDYETDRINQNFSMFTGGTRVLVEGRLGFRDIKIAITGALCLIAVLGLLLVTVDRDVSPLLITVMLLIGLFFGFGYTVPPLKFSYRGLGEIVVGGTHSFYLVLCGYVFQGGAWEHALPWLLSIPLFFAVLGAITLADLPDRPADLATSKRTVAVIFGPKAATVLASCCIAVAALSALPIFHSTLNSRRMWAAGSIIVVLHACALLRALIGLLRSGAYDRRIDNVMHLALSYIIWFGVIPLVSFL